MRFTKTILILLYNIHVKSWNSVFNLKQENIITSDVYLFNSINMNQYHSILSIMTINFACKQYHVYLSSSIIIIINVVKF